MKMEHKALSSLPKIELHLHLDCSLSFAVVKKLRPQIPYGHEAISYIRKLVYNIDIQIRR
jgi:adenosine deaminase